MQNYFELFDLKTSFFIDDEALKQLNGALLIRKELKREDLVESTNRAIKGLREIRT